jgi:DNA-binding CsgD family transcriptional regulator
VQSALRGMPMAAICVPRPDDGIPLTVLASSVRGQDVERFAAGHLKGAAVILFIVDPAGKAAIPAAWLTDAYGLTQAEASVAVAASMHGTVAETASQLNLSPNTVKTHLRHVFAKTGVSRRTELSSLMAALRMVRGQ